MKKNISTLLSACTDQLISATNIVTFLQNPLPEIEKLRHT